MHVSHTAHAASDPADIISDFKFSPATITIHVGDTITWTNNGPAPHTATASNGSFDTGNLNKGQSASHTFTQAGTFAYICSIHPFMHGTVVVLANASTTNNNSSGSGGSSTLDDPDQHDHHAGGGGGQRLGPAEHRHEPARCRARRCTAGRRRRIAAPASSPQLSARASA